MWMVFFWAQLGDHAFMTGGCNVQSHADGLRKAVNWMQPMAAHWAEVQWVDPEMIGDY